MHSSEELAHRSEGAGRCGRTEGCIHCRAESGGAQRAARQKLVLEPHFVAATRFQVMTSIRKFQIDQKKANIAQISLFAVFFLFIIIQMKKMSHEFALRANDHLAI